jgi:hypothetical protein
MIHPICINRVGKTMAKNGLGWILRGSQNQINNILKQIYNNHQILKIDIPSGVVMLLGTEAAKRCE